MSWYYLRNFAGIWIFHFNSITCQHWKCQLCHFCNLVFFRCMQHRGNCWFSIWCLCVGRRQWVQLRDFPMVEKYVWKLWLEYKKNNDAQEFIWKVLWRRENSWNYYKYMVMDTCMVRWIKVLLYLPTVSCGIHIGVVVLFLL